MQQIDWSSGGDGIVVRSSIKSVADLQKKTITLAQNSPSEYYLTSLLLSAGLKPADITLKYTATAFEAAAAFVADKRVDACVSWAPDIYNIPERVAGTRILSSTKDANKLIADVYAFRADFARDHPEIVEGLVAGIFEGMDLVKDKPGRGGEVDGRRLRHEAGRHHGHAQRRAPDQLRGKRPVLPELLQSDELRAHLEERELRLPRAGPDHQRPCRSTR